VERYTDTVSGEELYVVKRFNYKHYYKDRAMTIYHRIDGPAIEYDDGSKLWWVDGKRHRLDGPAMIWSNGTTDWYIDGVFIMELDKNGQIINRMK
jgi:hypothetical protein